ncbi:STAS domain-containing protein [Saccharothrix sp. 6-C]|uniref:STAS domain-containing protein n=1 Tax=Saccharothrix sp. 6-C TaxID=2781735 RepID=UPI0019171BAD|nr:STAS domain-containing protein [Saccharothrix sp. 6-C]QQQ73475.1 STAS domain-containing protein [Saccharothrix sp. 6-C]
MLDTSSKNDIVTVEATSYRGVPVLAVRGELDSTTIQPLRTGLSDQLDQRPPGLVLDLSGVTFMGSTGLQALADAIVRSRQSGTVLAVAAGHRAVLLPIGLTGLDGAVVVRPTVHDAVAAVLPR